MLTQDSASLLGLLTAPLYPLFLTNNVRGALVRYHTYPSTSYSKLDIDCSQPLPGGYPWGTYTSWGTVSTLLQAHKVNLLLTILAEV